MRSRWAGVDEGADVDALIQRITQAKGGHAFAQAGQEGLGDAFLHEQARAGAADFALVEPDGVDEAFDGRFLVGVFEDEEGRFAAELEGEAQAAPGGGLADAAADFAAAGEGQLGEAFALDEGGATFIAAGDDIDDAGRQAGFGEDFGEAEGAEAGLRARV